MPQLPLLPGMKKPATSSDKPDMKKYERMKKIGMPLDSILNRMRMDGVDKKIINEWGGGTTKKTTETEDEDIMGNIKTNKSLKLKPFHWSKLNKKQASNTIFKNVDKKIKEYKIEYNKIEKLFENIVYKKDDNKEDNSLNNNELQQTALIDPKRAYNVEIGLSRIKLSHDEILDAIIKLDDKLLPPDKVRKIIQYVPNDTELEQVRDYVKQGGDINKLTQVEQFFVKLMDLSQIKERLKLWLFKSEFPNIITNVESRINMIEECLTNLKNNNKLIEILNIILCLGNYMNSHSIRGNAYGFYMEPTLDLLTNMKSNKDNNGNQISLMYFLIETIYYINKKELIQWVNELEDLSLASKVQTNGLIQDIDAIKRDMKSIKKKINQQRRTMTKTHADWVKQGAAVPLGTIAKHIRNVSKKYGMNDRQKEFMTYASLPKNFGYLGGAAKVNINPTQLVANAEELKDEDDNDNEFNKIMLLFYKNSNSKLTDLENKFKSLELLTKEINKLFGFDEDRKFEDIITCFHLFRNKFMKGLRKYDEYRQKEKRKKQIKQQGINLQKTIQDNKNKKEESSNIDLDAPKVELKQRASQKQKMLSMLNKSKQKKTGDRADKAQVWL